MNSAVPFWFQSADEGDGPVPPIPTPDIGRSLRFRGTQRLTRTMTSNGGTTWTWSAWIKKTQDVTGDEQIFGTASPLFYCHIRSNSFGWTTSTQTDNETALRRDPSAWYHRVDISDGTTIRMFINGVLTTTWTQSSVGINTNVEHFLGGDTARANEFFEGYLADIYFIDGQALEATTFGRYNNRGIWIPRVAPADLRFDAAANPTYSNFLTAPNGFSTADDRGPEGAFNGLVSSSAAADEGWVASTNTGNMTFAPPGGIAFTSTVEVWGWSDQGNNFSFNGAAATLVNSYSWQTLATGGGTINTIELSPAGTNSATHLCGIRINGDTILIDPFRWEKDVFVTPDANRDWTSTTQDSNSFNPVDNGPYNGFDGDQNSDCEVAQNNTVFWRPEGGYENVTQIEIFAGAGCNVWLNENQVATGVTTTRTEIYNGPAITLETLGFSGSARPRFSQIWINGETVLDGINPAYGANGFRLQFQDPNDIGLDSSGNNNEWTPNANFDTNPIGIFSNQIFTAASSATIPVNPTAQNFNTTNAGFEQDDAFNGDNTTGALSDAGGGSWIQFRPTTAIRATTSLSVRCQTVQTIAVNGTDTTLSQTVDSLQTVDLSAQLTFPLNLATLSIRGNGGNNPRLCTIIVDGTELTDNTGADFDSMQDSPTQNWATLNPNQSNLGIGNTAIPFVAPEDGNLQIPANSNATSNVRYPSFQIGNNQAFRFESFNPAPTAGVGNPAALALVNTDTNVNRNVIGGAGDVGNPPCNTAWYVDVANRATYGWDIDAGAWINGSTGITNAAINDGNTQAILNWNTIGTCDWWIVMPDGNQGNVNTSANIYNFGQQGFQSPAADGFVALQTQNLPATSVTDGRQHCRVLQAGGASILACAEGEINDQHGSSGFASGLYWIKDRANGGTQWQLFSTASASGDTYNVVANNSADVSFDPYAAPAGNSVAYCWSTTTSGDFTDGTINSTCFTDQSGGFSVVRYSGDGNNNATVAHNLPGEVDFMVVAKFDGTGSNHLAYWRQEGNASVPFNTNNAFANNATVNAWGTNTTAGTAPSGGQPTATNATTFQLGNLTQVNNNGEEYQAWCWTTISGYSKFGQYMGQNAGTSPNATGPMIYTGFTPRVILIKGDNAGDDWFIFDSTQNDQNPADTQLELNNTNAQSTADDNAIDFLANGFVLRNTQGALNGNGTDFYYAAWAAAPFGANGILPTPAALQSPQPTPADAGAGVVSNSLRFRNTQFLFATGLGRPAGNFTLSMWVKITAVAGDGQGLYCANTGVNDGYQLSRGTDGLVRVRSSAGFATLSDGRLRDAGSWYNLVFQNDGGTTTLFINGARQTNTQTTFPASTNTIIGASNNNVPDEVFNGYMADVYLVEQLIAPTGFGTYNDQGVWVPRTEAEITTTITDAGGYGDDGFKLIMNQSNIFFGDNPVLQDQSGNNNDFVMNNFELIDEDSVNFDLMVDGPSVNFSTINPLNVSGPAFNPNTLNANLAANLTLTQADWAASCGVALASGQYYYESTYTQNCTIGVCVSNVGGANSNSRAALICQSAQATQGFTQDDLDTNGGGNTTTFNLGLAPQANGTVGCRVNTVNRTLAFTFDGTTYSNNLTYAEPPEGVGAIVPYLSAGVAQPSNQQLTINFGQKPFEFAVPNGFESLQGRNLPAAAITDGSTQFQALVGPSAGAAAAGANQLLGNFSPFLTPIAGTNLPGWDDGDATDAFDGSTATFAGTGNPGTWVFAPDVEITVTTQVRVFSLSTAGTVTWNGQTATFNGGWVVLTAAGAISRNTPITGTTIGAGQSCFIDAFEVDGDVLIDGSILAVAQNAFANALWWIKQTDGLNQHQLLDSVRGGNNAIQSPANGVPTAYQVPGGNSVAWCWNFNAADPAANGFQIIEYTGNGVAGRAVPHNLGQVPQFRMIKRLTGGAAFISTTSVALAGNANNLLFLNSDAAATATGGSQDPGNWTATDTFVGSGTAENNLDDDYIMYLWAPIAGYSSFGSYVGNSSTDGPFIYTGFRPGFLMTKRITAAEDWSIVDYARNPVNPAFENLRPNQQNGNGNNQAANAIDILSNGFKLRNDTNRFNNTGTYLYVAYAESPFGGDNVQPANAR